MPKQRKDPLSSPRDSTGRISPGWRGRLGRLKLAAPGSVFSLLSITFLMIATLLYSLPAAAQALPRTVPGAMSNAAGADLHAVSWVQMTILSMALVLTLWAMLSSLRRIAEKLRWVSPHQSVRLRRALQVGIGGLLLVAVFIPYLAEHYPLLALATLPALGLIAALVLSQRAPEVADQNPGY